MSLIASTSDQKKRKKSAEFTKTSEAVNLGSPTRDHHIVMINVPDLIARGLALHLGHELKLLVKFARLRARR